jgi:hypothetical protein
MLVVVRAHDTEVATAGAPDRSMILAMATMATAAQVSVSLCRWFDKWRAGWLLTVIGKCGSRAPPFSRVKNVRFGLSAAKRWPADMIKHHRLATSRNIRAASTCVANAAPVAVYRNELRHECKIFRNFPLGVPKLGPAHAVNPEKPNLAYCAICAPPNAEDGLGVSMFGNIDV